LQIEKELCCDRSPDKLPQLGTVVTGQRKVPLQMHSTLALPEES
jgi:hypothetical protein